VSAGDLEIVLHGMRVTRDEEQPLGDYTERSVRILSARVGSDQLSYITALELRVADAPPDQARLLYFPFQLFEDGGELFIKYRSAPEEL